MKKIGNIYCFILALLLLGISESYGQGFRTLVRKNTVAVNERFQISFQLENLDAQSIDYPDFKGFQRVLGPQISQQASYQTSNGKLKQSVTISYTFVLAPLKKGDFTIGSAKVTDRKGKVYKTDPIKIKVSDAAKNAAGNKDAGAVNRQQAIEAELKQMIFLRAYVSKKKLYQGDQFVVTYKLFHAPEIAGRLNSLELEEAPGYEGFWAEKVDLKNSQPALEVVNGRRFYVSVLKQDILIPQKSGKLKIDPLTVSMIVPIPKQRKRRRDPFDPFADLDDLFQSPFGRHENFKFLAKNTPINIEVEALPAGKPANYSGLVGDLKMDVKLSTDTIDAGEAVTLSIKYSGQGNLPKIQAPKLTFPADFEVYDPKTKERVSRVGGRLSGSKSFDYLIIPRIPGDYEIPKIEVSYFDPKAKRYRSLSKERFPLTVTGEAPVNVSDSGSSLKKEDLELLGQDIRHIHTAGPDFEDRDSFFLGSPTFWTLLSLPFICFLVVYFWNNKRKAQEADVVGTRSRKAVKQAKKRLSLAQSYIKESKEREFFDEVSRVLWGYAGDKLALGQSDLSREQVSQLLIDKGAENTTVESLNALVDQCEFAIFAPSSAEVGMENTYDKALNLIIQLEKEMA
ncbi:MAG: BatD family protein [Bacteroidota bacterium]